MGDPGQTTERYTVPTRRDGKTGKTGLGRPPLGFATTTTAGAANNHP